MRQKVKANGRSKLTCICDLRSERIKQYNQKVDMLDQIKKKKKKTYTLYTGDILDLNIQIDEKQKDGKKQRGYSKYKQKQTLRQKRTSNKKVYFRIIKGSVFKIIINLHVPNNSPKHMQQKVTGLKDS